MKRPWLARIWTLQKGLCWICMEPMIPYLRHHPLSASFDHIIPLSKGGYSGERNYLLAHRDCNSARKNELPIELSQGYSLRKFKDRVISKCAALHGKRMRGLRDADQTGKI